MAKRSKKTAPRKRSPKQPMLPHERLAYSPIT